MSYSAIGAYYEPKTVQAINGLGATVSGSASLRLGPLTTRSSGGTSWADTIQRIFGTATQPAYSPATYQKPDTHVQLVLPKEPLRLRSTGKTAAPPPEPLRLRSTGKTSPTTPDLSASIAALAAGAGAMQKSYGEWMGASARKLREVGFNDDDVRKAASGGSKTMSLWLKGAQYVACGASLAEARNILNSASPERIGFASYTRCKSYETERAKAEAEAAPVRRTRTKRAIPGAVVADESADAVAPVEPAPPPAPLFGTRSLIVAGLVVVAAGTGIYLLTRKRR
jgi:hypothetical protein